MSSLIQWLDARVVEQRIDIPCHAAGPQVREAEDRFRLGEGIHISRDLSPQPLLLPRVGKCDRGPPLKAFNHSSPMRKAASVPAYGIVLPRTVKQRRGRTTKVNCDLVPKNIRTKQKVHSDNRTLASLTSFHELDDSTGPLNFPLPGEKMSCTSYNT